MYLVILKCLDFKFSEVLVEDHYTVDAQPQFSSSAINNGDEVYYDTEINDFPVVQDMYFRFNITPSADLVAAPGQHLIKRLIIEANKGIDDELLRLNC